MCLYYSFSVLTSLFYSKYRHYKILSFFLCLGLDLWSNYLNTFTTYLQYWPLNPKLIDRILWIPVPDVWTEIERQREREKERERERMREREREKERERDMPNWKTSFAESEECWPGWIWHSRFGGRRKSERGRESEGERERRNWGWEGKWEVGMSKSDERSCWQVLQKMFFGRSKFSSWAEKY